MAKIDQAFEARYVVERIRAKLREAADRYAGEADRLEGRAKYLRDRYALIQKGLHGEPGVLGHELAEWEIKALSGEVA